MLASARQRQRQRDAEFEQNSPESRFDCAYTAIRAVADIGLQLQGYRTSTSKPGHRQTAIQSLSITLGVDDLTVRVLDGLRKQRNLTDYDDELVTDAALSECIESARVLVTRIEKALALHPAFG